jgi:hypothetical protein
MGWVWGVKYRRYAIPHPYEFNDFPFDSAYLGADMAVTQLKFCAPCWTPGESLEPL